MPADTPAWYAKPFTLTFPVGVLVVLGTALIGAASAGGVGVVTRDGDLSAVEAAVEARIESSADQLRREDAAAATLAAARYEEILRRLDRIERRMDEDGR